ncbi:helix-turn-helix domain-containing protein [Pseudodesulfovibrio senegalensis]|jgi:AraC-like DNA-binding protein|uniref:AraC family transcriptional regulator n=1 Tax=Pseudodesulfovibrio senegalensis TaxID=1721087 RepID=A0A6N6MZ39_9BACT|nr:AraC family transcriptional regulator [Pseudodesulfovibrio senegalensis]KAB1439136.1 AraC family transcriptional regulator [Pseudodesulfovibrio senegalensis]
MQQKYKDGLNYMRVPALPGVGLVHAESVSRGVSRHAHDSLCFGAVLAGSRDFLSGDEHTTVRTGQVMAINPQEVHACGMEGPCSYVMFSVEPDALARALRSMDLPDHPLPRIRDMVINDPKLYGMIARLAEITLRHGDPLESQTLYLDILSRLLDEHADIPPAPMSDEPEAVTRARAFLNANFAQPISLDELARQAGLSPFHLSRMFTARVGLPPHEYQVSRRVRRAKKMLADGEPAAQVAAECGFADQSHLSRAFKRIMGMTPGQYAQAHLSR